MEFFTNARIISAIKLNKLHIKRMLSVVSPITGLDKIDIIHISLNISVLLPCLFDIPVSAKRTSPGL